MNSLVNAQSSAPGDPSDPNSDENIQRRKAGKIVERNNRGQLLRGSTLPSSGRKVGLTLETVVRQVSGEAVSVLIDIMRTTRSEDGARVQAATTLLSLGEFK